MDTCDAVDLQKELNDLSKDSLVDIILNLVEADEEATLKLRHHIQQHQRGINRKRKFTGDKENCPAEAIAVLQEKGSAKNAEETSQALLAKFPLRDEVSAKIFIKSFFREGKALGPCSQVTARSREKWRGKDLLVNARGAWDGQQASPVVTYDAKKVINLSCACSVFSEKKECPHVAGLLLHLIAYKQTMMLREMKESIASSASKENQININLASSEPKDMKTTTTPLIERERKRMRKELEERNKSATSARPASRLW